jgi:hypothetical protein
MRERCAMWQRRLPTLSAVVALVIVTACEMPSAVWIEKGSTVAHLVFGIGRTKHGKPLDYFPYFSVFSCSTPEENAKDAIWAVSSQPGSAIPTRILYGEAPPGWETDQGPVALTPGCYDASTPGTGHVRFDVDSAGGVTERK